MKKYALITLISLVIGFSIGHLSNKSCSNIVSAKSQINPTTQKSFKKESLPLENSQKKNKLPTPKAKNIKLKLSQVYDLATEDQEREFESLLQQYPNSWRLLEAYTNSLIYRGDFSEKAEELLIRCLQEKKTSELCQSNLAHYYVETDQLQKASEQTKKCLELLPKSMSCLNNYATESLRKRDYAKALQLFLEMEKVNGQGRISFQPHLIQWGIGLSYKGLAQLELAADYFTLACQNQFQPACHQLELLESN